jgi:hypothetical protein
LNPGFGTLFRRRNTLPDDQLDLLRSVLAHAYDKRQRFPLRLLQVLRDYIGPRTVRTPIIENLNIIERETGTAWTSSARGTKEKL